MNNDQRSQLVQAIQNALAEQQPKGTGPIAAPAIINTRGADPVLRARALTAYAAACMDVPHTQWDATMTSAVREETVRVCREAGY
jgi:hypothetical protein